MQHFPIQDRSNSPKKRNAKIAAEAKMSKNKIYDDIPAEEILTQEGKCFFRSFFL